MTTSADQIGTVLRRARRLAAETLHYSLSNSVELGLIDYHPLGFLKLEIKSVESEKLRVFLHIWHPLAGGRAAPHPAHAHWYRSTSMVLHGCVRAQKFSVEYSDTGSFAVSRSGSDEVAREKCIAPASCRADIGSVIVERYNARSAYVVEPGEYHHVLPEPEGSVALTLFVQEDSGAPFEMSRVLTSEPIHTEERHSLTRISPDEKALVLSQAWSLIG